MRSMIHTPTLLQSQGTRHIYTQPPPRASRILSLPCVPGMTQATELHGRTMARPGQPLSWPLDTAQCCHNITMSWASTSNHHTGPLQSPEGPGARAPC